MELPDTAPTALFVTRTAIIVDAGHPAPAGVNVTISPAVDHENVPATAGVVPNAACTLLVPIGSLNCNATGEQVGTDAASCKGELLTTTGSRGCQSVCATKIFAVVAGTVIGGISGVEVTVNASFVSNRLMILVPGAQVVERLVSV